MHKAQTQKGFTIVELLIVIVVIGILASITIVAYNGIQSRARDASRDNNVKQLKTALELYKADNGFYPAACAGGDNSGCNTSYLSSALVPNYISLVPSSGGLDYVRGAAASDSYGILINYEAKPRCKTGVNVANGWWGTNIPIC